MRRKLLTSAGVIVAALFCEPTVSAQNLVTENYPPFTMIDPNTGSVTGLSVDILAELMRRSHDSVTVAVYPWPRSYRMAKLKSDTCVFSTARTPLRETLFKWIGPLAPNNFVVFGRSTSIDRPTSLDDLRGKTIGTKVEDASTEFLASRGYRLDMVAIDSDNPRKLIRGRFDYWATSESVGTELIRQQGLSKQIVPLFSFNRLGMYLACNLDMQQSKVDRWNQILKEMEKDGTSPTIRKKYLLTE